MSEQLCLFTSKKVTFWKANVMPNTPNVLTEANPVTYFW